MSRVDSKSVIANRIKKLRIDSGLTQQKLADVFSISRPCICYWENGKRIPDYKTLSDLADYFNVSIDYLIGRSNDVNSRLEVVIKNPSETLDISRLDDHYKSVIKDFYSFLLSKQKMPPVKKSITY